MMKRRAFVTGLGIVLLAPRVGEAPPAGKPARIGWLTSSVVHKPNVDAFREGMRALGYPAVVLECQAVAVTLPSCLRLRQP
jgi:hypothetical protein